MTDSMTVLVRRVARDNNLNLCTLFVSRALELNVTFMTTTSGLKSAGALCVRANARFEDTVTVTSSPSAAPSAAPTAHSSTPRPTPATLFSSTFVGVITIVILVGFLRLNPTLATIIMPKEKPRAGHLYDILVVISDEEEAIIENIRHEDIVFLRRIAKSDIDQTDSWMMNTSAEALEARFEVQFYDHYDLLGESGPSEENVMSDVGHKVIGSKLVTKETYIHEASLHVGMIIRVKPALPPGADEDAAAHDGIDRGISCDDGSSHSSEVDISEVDIYVDDLMLREPEATGRGSGNVVNVKASKIAVDTDLDTDMSVKCMSNLSSLTYTKHNRSFNDGWSCNESVSASASGKSERGGRPKNIRMASFESQYSLKDADCPESNESYNDAEDSMSIDLPLDAHSLSLAGPHKLSKSLSMSSRSRVSVGSSKGGRKDKDKYKEKGYERKIGSFFSPHHGFNPSPTPPTLISIKPRQINLFDEQRGDSVEEFYLPTPESKRSRVEKIVFSPERRSSWWNRYTQKQTHKRRVEKSVGSSSRRGSHRSAVHDSMQAPSIDEFYQSKDENA
jgi:hypothetical protein